MSKHLMVVAIDFGTTYSGYAFSMKSDFLRDPLQIHANQAWNAGKKQLLSLKTPTCLLLDGSTDIVSFGYEAEDTYAELVLDERHHEYYFFDRFKMRLYQEQDLSGEMELEDVTGKKLLAIEVFGKAIKALTDHFMKLLEMEGKNIIKMSEIQWVLTVPAIWSDGAKQFMRKSAAKAYIQDENLLIALEPEAASIYCQYLPKERLVGMDQTLNIGERGMRYMVVDLGGGTADITVHEKVEGGKVKELCRANGSECGGTSVDKAFMELFENMSGFPLIPLLKKEDPTAFLDISREFEAVKRKIDTNTTGKVNFCIPITTLNKLCEKQCGQTLESLITQSSYNDLITLRGDKIRIDHDLMKSLFAQTIEKVTNLISQMYAQSIKADVNLILLVGGFSECRLIHTAIKQAFPDKRVIVPEECGLAVLKGAVLFGHRPDFIESRVMRYSYGTDTYVEFDPALHDKSRKIKASGKEQIEIFDIIVKQNTSVLIGTEVQHAYDTMIPYQKSIMVSIYVIEKEEPKYINEVGCIKIGEVEIFIPNPSAETRTVNVQYIFGKTELSVSAKEITSGSECNACIKLI